MTHPFPRPPIGRPIDPQLRRWLEESGTELTPWQRQVLNESFRQAPPRPILPHPTQTPLEAVQRAREALQRRRPELFLLPEVPLSSRRRPRLRDRLWSRLQAFRRRLRTR